MIGGLLAAALLVSGQGDAMDAIALREAMDSARRAPATETLAGRSFRIAIPFVDEQKRTMKALQSPARWRYDFSRGELTLMIGLGQISAANYDRFADQGLADLPTLQTAFFDGSEIKNPVAVEVLDGRTKRQDVGVQSIITNYGLAIPYAEGASALPPRFQPFMVYKLRMNQETYHRLTRGMTLVLEGRITSLGQRPEVFCGDYAGRLAAPELHIDDTTHILVTAHQCFATARVDAVSVMGSGKVLLAAWGAAGR
ncbi:hypothetical protein PMI01_03381 [Caulobacter sp. AP07]|uniref:hypothetical protein n=1 Tax=Caulobacter sp. AP07 TaxID=1144304 RepID=UPI0002722072|nr:hypothetical protein [Caulobacter sp. AP07]EJL29220.1 hypothetical protein PMI01_03381 [Caulobacter sp. AP07]